MIKKGKKVSRKKTAPAPLGNYRDMAAAPTGIENGMSLPEVFEKLSLGECPKLLQVVKWDSVGEELLVLIAD